MLTKTGTTEGQLRANEARVADIVAGTHPRLAADAARVTADLTRLAAVVAAHSGADTSVGILEDILNQAPRLSADVRTLERDHRELPGLLLELRIRARQLQSDIEEAFSRLAAHHRMTEHLVYEAFATDLGEGD